MTIHRAIRLFGGLPILVTLALINGSSGSAAPANATISEATLDNLQAAFNGESNAHERYLAFANKADEEGYGPVASLFRAAARAEEIHARNHAAVIRKFDVTPRMKLEIPVVNSTRENLGVAIQGETYERDQMYPGFVEQARLEGAKAALQTFEFARLAEAEHARLYAEALSDLENMRGASRVFYVCPVCGFTAAKLDFARCPTCLTPEEQYEEVS